MRLFYIILCVFVAAFSGLAQDNQAVAIDSIKQVLPSQEGLERVNSYNELAWYYKNFDLDSALYFSKQALNFAEFDGGAKAISSASNSMANTFEALGNLDSSEFYHQKSLAIRMELQDSLGMASSYNNLGIVYDQKGAFSKSLEHYFQALKLYEDHSDDKFNVAMVLGNIGIVYKKQKAYDQVLEYYNRALKIYEEVGSQFGQVVTKGNIGSTLIQLERYPEVIEISEQALAGYAELGYDRYVPYMQHNIGVANDSLGKLDEAISFYNAAIEGHTTHQNQYELANTYSALAGAYLKQKRAGNAKRAALQANRYAKEAKAFEFEVNSMKFLAEANAALGFYGEAFGNYKAYAVGRDSLFEEDKTKQIFQLREEYETAKKEDQIDLQNAELELRESKLQRNQVLIIGLIVVAVMLVIIFLLEKNRAKRKAQLKLREAEINAVINSQEKERNRFARDLHDGFGQLISVLRLSLSQLDKTAANDMEKRDEAFKNGEAVIDEMYTELRNICFDLMPQTLVKKGLEPALKEFGNRINQTGTISCEVLTFLESSRFKEVEEISLFRITQEWVNNILKYANASHITIQLTQEGQEVTLTMEDDGDGFDPETFYQGKGNGWRNIQTRLKQISGNFDLDSAPGRKESMVSVNATITAQHIPTSTDNGIGELRDTLPTT